MAQYDGSIRINTKIDNKEASAQLMALENRITKTADKISSLRSKMDALKDAKIPTQEYSEITAQIQKSEAEFNKLLEKQEQMQREGKDSGAAWDRLNARMEEIGDAIRYAQGELQELVDTGKAFTPGSGTEEYKKLGQQLSYAENDLAALNQRYDEKTAKLQEQEAEEQRLAQIRENAVVGNQQIIHTLEQIKQLEQEIADLKKAGVTEGYKDYDDRIQKLLRLKQEVKDYNANIGNTKENYKKLGNTAKQSFEKVNKSAKKSNGFLSTMSSRFKGLALSLFIFNQISNAFRALANGIKEGFGNLYKGNENFRNTVDSLKASLLTLKNNLAAAFAPLVQTVIPYIQRAVEWLTELIGKIGQFIAAASGQKTYLRAVKQTTEALKEQNKAQNKQLSSLDKINNLSSGDNGAGDGAGSAAEMFEEVPVDENIVSIFGKIAEYAQNLKNIFSQGFWDGLGDWEYRFESVKDSIASIKDNLRNIFLDPGVLSSADRWVQSIVYTFGSLVGSMASIGLTIATNFLGGIEKFLEQDKERIKNFLISMFDIQAEVNMMFAEFFQSIAYVFEAFASEQAQQLTANIIGIFADIFMGVWELGAKFFRDIAQIFIQPFVDNKEAFREALEGFLGVLSEVTGTIREGIEETFNNLNKVYDEHFKPFFDSIAGGLSDTVGKFMEFWNENVQPILEEWAAGFDQLWKEHIQPAINNFVGLLGKAAEFLKAVWENVLKPLIDWIIQNVLPVILPVIDGIVKAVMILFGAISDVVGGIFNVLGGVIDFLTGVFTGDWGKAWESIVNVFKGIFNLIPTIVEGVINSAISVVNGIIGGINKVTGVIGIPQIPSIPEVSIPRLATGTVVPPNREFLAVLGDNKREPEVVSPLSTMKQAFKEAMSEMGGGFGNGKIELRVTANVEGRTLFEITQDYAMDYFNRTGRSPYPI